MVSAAARHVRTRRGHEQQRRVQPFFQASSFFAVAVATEWLERPISLLDA